MKILVGLRNCQANTKIHMEIQKIIPDFKTNYKIIVIKMVVYSYNNRQLNGMKESRNRSTFI